jgi:hypothetical protein
MVEEKKRNKTALPKKYVEIWRLKNKPTYSSYFEIL